MSDATVPHTITDNRGPLWFAAILAVVLGVLALFAPLAAGIAATYVLGAYFVVGGLLEVFAAFRAQGWGGALGLLALGIASIIAGLFIFGHPLVGLVSITVVLIAGLMATGILKIIWSFRLPGVGRWYILASGVASILISLLLFVNFPLSAAWAVGVLLGVNMLVEGFSLMFFLRR